MIVARTTCHEADAPPAAIQFTLTDAERERISAEVDQWGRALGHDEEDEQAEEHLQEEYRRRVREAEAVLQELVSEAGIQVRFDRRLRDMERQREPGAPEAEPALTVV